MKETIQEKADRMRKKAEAKRPYVEKRAAEMREEFEGSVSISMMSKRGFPRRPSGSNADIAPLASVSRKASQRGPSGRMPPAGSPKDEPFG